MFANLSRSWSFARISYNLLWEHKKLLVFPAFSTVAATLVTASFLLPLWGTGKLQDWLGTTQETTRDQTDPTVYAVAFLFYFCTYFVIVFFNCALTACALKVVRGEEPSIAYGLSVAKSRLPRILGWAVVSAIVGVVLKTIENANDKAARFVVAILGSAWTALTYFVVPVIVIDDVGPIEAFKRSTRTLRSAWGTALMGNFSLGLLSFLLSLPILALVATLFVMAFSTQSTGLIVAAGVLAVLSVAVIAASSSAADVIFKAVLFNYATGQSLPTTLDRDRLAHAFASKQPA